MARPARLLAALGPDAHGPADADLLARFARHRDAGAFELLVYRHAPLVLRACRAVLRDHHAAEDAAQAVFLALARQAHAVHGGTLPGWLFRVSRRVAGRLARRQPPAAAADLDALPAPATAPAPDPADVRLLHDELARLPAAYRDPLLLLYFEGLTRDEAARRLGWPAGTVAGRVARAKQRLADRLARRGVTLGAMVFTAEAVPPGFAGAMAEAAVGYVAGSTAGMRVGVAGLANHEMRRTAMTKAMKLAGVVLACGVVALGAGAVTGEDPPAGPPAAASEAQPPGPADPAPAPPKAFIGRSFAVAPVTTDLQRRLLRGRPDLAAFVAVDGNGLFPDDKSLAFDALDLNGLRFALRQFRPAPARAVHFRTYFFDAPKAPRPPEAGRALVDQALEGAGRRAGFGGATAWSVPAHREWRGFIAPLRDDAGAADPEPGEGDDKARAYRVRTPLSRVLTGGMAGVLDVRVPFDTRNGDVAVPDGVADSARRALRGLRVPRAGRVSVLFHQPDGWEDEGVRRRLNELAVDWAAAEGLVGVMGG